MNALGIAAEVGFLLFALMVGLVALAAAGLAAIGLWRMVQTIRGKLT